MTPKAQQLDSYAILTSTDNNFDQKKQQDHRESLSDSYEPVTTDNRTANPSAYFSLYSLSIKVTRVISPAIVLLVATPIALQYPLIQLMMLLTILFGTSPLYFIIITFTGKSPKLDKQCETIQQPHRRQPSIVGAIADMQDEKQIVSK